DADLVVKTVVYPALNLRFGALAAVHCYMERMVNVIAGSLRAQLLLKLFFSPGRLYWWTHDCLSDRDVHPIIGHFDAEIFQFSVFRRILIQDGVGVIDVNEHLAARLQWFQHFVHASGSGLRHMPDL